MKTSIRKKARPYILVCLALSYLLSTIILSGCIMGMFAKKATNNRVDFGSWTLTNDTWGALPEEALSSGVFMNDDKTFGWYWDRANPLKKPGETYVKPIFPNARIGGTHLIESTTKTFPIKLKDIKSMTFDVAYDYLTKPTGSYNLAYEMFFTNTDRPDPNLVPRVEVMIWLEHTFPQPPNTLKGTYSDSGNSYDLNSWTMADGRDYYSFSIQKLPPLPVQHRADASNIFNQLSLDQNLYLMGIQFGNEVVEGSGRIKISQLKITLNGREL